MDIQFLGEQLFPGKLGHFFAILAFVASLLSAWSYFRSAQSEGRQPQQSRRWLLLGRNSFIIHSAATWGIFFTLYYIITNHLFEYHYAWQHSSRSLPMKYLLSSFWEGQQGSFLLWSIWNSVLGLVLMRTGKVLENRTMAVVAVVQALLATMLLGFYLSDVVQIGQSPFQLLRVAMQEAPIFQQANYLQSIQDGNGLNVLLQNYWMVIHPPVLFLGFSAVLFPFAYVVAALWKKEYSAFVKPAINWSLFAGGTLGLGIMMGGAWAYESLTFGGYWAWDPVENASLVPWLILVAGLHTLVVYKATGRSLFITFILLTLSYLFIWYSTFLTRTGVLGETSVHAFTGEGKSLYWHLLVVIALLLLLSFGLLFSRKKNLPTVVVEEQVSTREFWMFIGSIVLLLASIQIIVMTSLPVWSPLAKWITGKQLAPPVDVIAQYNSIHVWVAIVLGLLTATVLFLKFKKTDMRVFWRRMGLAGGLALALTIIIAITQNISKGPYVLLLFSACFGVIANVLYIIKVQKWKMKKTGPAIAHLGFALMLLGILLSSYNKEVISVNVLGKVWDFGRGMEENIRESRENVIMYRDVPVAIGDYTATYLGDSISDKDVRMFYRVEYVHRTTGERFRLYPDAFLNPKGQEGLSANPDSKHYLTKDVFTYVTSAIDPSKILDTAKYHNQLMQVGDTTFLNNGYIVFSGFEREIKHPQVTAQDLAIAARIDAYKGDTLKGTLHPIFVISGDQVSKIEDTLDNLKLYARLDKIVPETGAADIAVRQTDRGADYIVMKALVFPFINILWLGILIMFSGFMLSLYNRGTKKEKLLAARK